MGAGFGGKVGKIGERYVTGGVVGGVVASDPQKGKGNQGGVRRESRENLGKVCNERGSRRGSRMGSRK